MELFPYPSARFAGIDHDARCSWSAVRIPSELFRSSATTSPVHDAAKRARRYASTRQIGSARSAAGTRSSHSRYARSSISEGCIAAAGNTAPRGCTLYPPSAGRRRSRIPHPSSLVAVPASLIPHPSSPFPHPSSLVASLPHPSSLFPNPSFPSNFHLSSGAYPARPAPAGRRIHLPSSRSGNQRGAVSLSKGRLANVPPV